MRAAVSREVKRIGGARRSHQKHYVCAFDGIRDLGAGKEWRCVDNFNRSILAAPEVDRPHFTKLKPLRCRLLWISVRQSRRVSGVS